MTPEEAIKIVKAKANLRTRYEGQDAFLDEVLVAEIERLRVDYARLHGVVQTYINADPQVRGEAYRDLTGTMEHLAGADETYGWPAVWQRQRAEIERLMAARDEVESTVLNSLHHIGWQWLEDRFTESKSPLHQRLSMVIHAMADHHNSYKTTLL